MSGLKAPDATLRESEERLRTYLDNSPEGVFIVDGRGRYIDVNLTGCKMLGYSKEEILGLSIPEITDKAALKGAMDGFRVLKETGRLAIETVLVKKNGSPFPIFLNAVSLPDDRYMAFCTDISDLKSIERAFRDSEERYRVILDQMADMVLLHDEVGRLMDVNQKACSLLGYDRGELLSMNIGDIDPNVIEEGKEDVWNRIRSGGSVTFESHLVTKQGKTIPIETTLGLVIHPKGPAILAIIRDITERKRVQESLWQSKRKLNILSNITRHDITNQLLVLKGNLGLLESKLPKGTEMEHIRKVEAAANRISEMIQFTKEYEDIGMKDPKWQDVRALVDSAAKVLHSENVAIVNDVPHGLEVFADPMIEKVFHNLIQNAVKHGGKVSRVRFYIEEVDGTTSLVCEDDGSGIQANMKKRLFTRGGGSDHGLGLFLTREILSITGISITENSAPSKGAKFVMALPEDGLRMVG